MHAARYSRRHILVAPIISEGGRLMQNSSKENMLHGSARLVQFTLIQSFFNGVAVIDLPKSRMALRISVDWAWSIMLLTHIAKLCSSLAKADSIVAWRSRPCTGLEIKQGTTKPHLGLLWYKNLFTYLSRTIRPIITSYTAPRWRADSSYTHATRKSILAWWENLTRVHWDECRKWFRYDRSQHCTGTTPYFKTSDDLFD